MKRIEICNAKIKRAEFSRSYYEEPLKLKLEICSTSGTAIMSFSLFEIEKIFTILEINDFRDIVNAPCIVLICDGIMKDIGKFLFYHYDGISFDKEKESWIFNDTLRKEIYNYAN